MNLFCGRRPPRRWDGNCRRQICDDLACSWVLLRFMVEVGREMIRSAFGGIAIENFRQMPVEVQHGSSARCLMGFDEELVGPGFFFYLLADEPMKQHLRGIIFLRERCFINGVDAGGVGAVSYTH